MTTPIARVVGRREQPPPAADDGVEVHHLRSSLGALSVALTHQTGRPVVHGAELARCSTSGSFDVVHFHNVSLVGGPGRARLWRSGKLYTAHEHWLVCPTHVLWRHRREPCTGRECVRCSLHYGRPPQLWRNTGLLERHLDDVNTFIALSEFSRDKHREFGFPRDMEVLPPIVFDAGNARAAPRDHTRARTSSTPADSSASRASTTSCRVRDVRGADLLIAGAGSERAALERAPPAIAARSIPRLPGRRGSRRSVLGRRAHRSVGVLRDVRQHARRSVPSERARPRAPHRSFPEIVGQRRGVDVRRRRRARARHADAACGRRAHALDGRARVRAFASSYSEDAIVPRYLEIVERFRPFDDATPSLAATRRDALAYARDPHVSLHRRDRAR